MDQRGMLFVSGRGTGGPPCSALVEPQGRAWSTNTNWSWFARSLVQQQRPTDRRRFDRPARQAADHLAWPDWERMCLGDWRAPWEGRLVQSPLKPADLEARAVAQKKLGRRFGRARRSGMHHLGMELHRRSVKYLRALVGAMAGEGAAFSAGGRDA